MTKVVVFDFDGVFVLDSDAVFKKAAWGEAFSGYAEAEWRPLLTEANQLYGNGKPGGRREIFLHVLQGLQVPEGELETKLEELNRRFGEYVRAKIQEAGLVDGVLDTVKLLYERGVRMYLNSGTATLPLRVSAEDLGLTPYLSGVYGSTPEPVGGGKVENLEAIELKEGVAREAMLMYGDGQSDYQAAVEFGCRFVGFANVHNGWAAEEKPFPVTSSMRQLPDLL